MIKIIIQQVVAVIVAIMIIKVLVMLIVIKVMIEVTFYSLKLFQNYLLIIMSKCRANVQCRQVAPKMKSSFDLSYFFSKVSAKAYVIQFYMYFCREQTVHLNRMVKSPSNVQKFLWRRLFYYFFCWKAVYFFIFFSSFMML